MSKRIRTATGAPAPVAPDATLQFFTHVPAGALGLAPGEEVRLSLPSVALHAGGAALGVGTLRVSTLRVAWLPDAGSSGGGGGGGGGGASASASASAPGYVLEYPRIVLHAICRDAEALHSPCLYCQVSGLPDAAESGGRGGAGAAGAGEGEGDDEDMGGGGGGAFDVYLAPSDAGALDGLFKAMTACAELHPDPQDEQQEGEEGEGMGGMGGGYAWAEALMAQEAAGGGEEAVAGQFEPPAAKE